MNENGVSASSLTKVLGDFEPEVGLILSDIFWLVPYNTDIDSLTDLCVHCAIV